MRKTVGRADLPKKTTVGSSLVIFWILTRHLVHIMNGQLDGAGL